MPTLKKFCAELKKSIPDHPSMSGSYLNVLENQIALQELRKLIAENDNNEEELNANNLMPFKDFLRNRWERIKKTDASYPHDSNNPLNKLYIKLAKDIANVTSENSYQLLMPTLIQPESAITFEDISEVPLHHFILSDDNQHWISLEDCFQGAEEAGTFRHTAYLVPGCDLALLSLKENEELSAAAKQTAETENKPILIKRNDKWSLYACQNNIWGESPLTLSQNEIKTLNTLDFESRRSITNQELTALSDPLSSLTRAHPDLLAHPAFLTELEKTRIRNHSPQAEQYFMAISHLVNLRHNTDQQTIGAYLQTLVNGLRLGGAHGEHGGSEMNAGADANLAILAFGLFLDKLDKSTKDKLFALQTPDNSDTFASLWGRLARPGDAVYTSTRYCVELTANGLESILKRNANMLYGDLLKPAEEKQKKAKNEFKKAMEKANFSVTASYGEQGETALKTSMFSSPDFSTANTTATNLYFEYLARLPHSSNKLSHQLKFLSWLKEIPAGLHSEPLIQQQKRLLGDIFSSWETVLTSLSSQEKGELIYRLLTHPNEELAQYVLNRIHQNASLKQSVSQGLNAAGHEILKKNWAKSQEYFEKSAELGNQEGMLKCADGFFLANKNLEKAALWYFKSYETQKKAADCDFIINKLKSISRQEKDLNARSMAIRGLKDIYLKRWEKDPFSMQTFNEKIEFLDILAKTKDNSEMAELLLSEIAFSFSDMLRHFQTSEKSEQIGVFIYPLLTHSNQKLRDRVRDHIIKNRDLKQKARNWLNDAGSKVNVNAERGYYEQAAILDSPLGAWKYAGILKKSTNPSDLINAVIWFAKSYPLWTSNKDRTDVIDELKKISLQDENREARDLARKHLYQIYQTRNSQDVAEKMDYLNLLQHLENVASEKEVVVNEIVASFEKELLSKNNEQKGELLYHLLTHSNQELRDRVRDNIIKNSDLKLQAGRWINDAGFKVDANAEKARGYYEQAAKLNNLDGTWNYALILKYRTNPPVLIDSVRWFAESYKLWKSREKSKAIIDELKKISLQNETTEARDLARTELYQIYRERNSQDFNEKMDYLNLLQQLENVASEKEAVVDEMIGSFDEKVLRQKTSEQKGELLYHLLTHSNPKLRDHVRKFIIKNSAFKEAGNWINDAGFKVDANAEKARGYYEQAAKLNHLHGTWNYALILKYRTNPPALIDAVRWFAECYELWKSNEKSKAIVDELKKISLQNENTEARDLARTKLHQIYRERNSQDFNEKMEYLNLLQQLENVASEKKGVVDEIVASFENALRSKTHEQKGILLYDLLTHPNQELSNLVREYIFNDGEFKLQAGNWITIAGVKANRGKGKNYYEQAAKLDDPEGTFNYATTLYNDTNSPDLINAAKWFAKSYRFFALSEKVQSIINIKVIINVLTTISSQNTDSDASRVAKKELELINSQPRLVLHVVKNSIINLPSLTSNTHGKIIVLDDGSRKKLPVDIAAQWHEIKKLEKSTFSIQDINKMIVLAKGKASPGLTGYSDYYSMLDKDIFDIPLQQRKDLSKLDTSLIVSELSFLKNQLKSTDIVKILKQSRVYFSQYPHVPIDLLPQNTELKWMFDATNDWINTFGTAETFLALEQTHKNELTYRIFEASYHRNDPLAKYLENTLIEKWKNDTSIASKVILLDFYTKKLSILNDPKKELTETQVKEKENIHKEWERLNKQLNPKQLKWHEKIKLKKFNLFLPASLKPAANQSTIAKKHSIRKNK